METELCAGGPAPAGFPFPGRPTCVWLTFFLAALWRLCTGGFGLPDSYGRSTTPFTAASLHLAVATSKEHVDMPYTDFGLRLINLAANLRGSLQNQRTGVEARTLQAYKRP